MCCLMGEQGAFTQMAVACQILYLVGLSIDFILFLALVSGLHFALTRLKYAQMRTVVAAHGSTFVNRNHFATYAGIGLLQSAAPS